MKQYKNRLSSLSDNDISINNILKNIIIKKSNVYKAEYFNRGLVLSTNISDFTSKTENQLLSTIENIVIDGSNYPITSEDKNRIFSDAYSTKVIDLILLENVDSTLESMINNQKVKIFNSLIFNQRPNTTALIVDSFNYEKIFTGYDNLEPYNCQYILEYETIEDNPNQDWTSWLELGEEYILGTIYSFGTQDYVLGRYQNGPGYIQLYYYSQMGMLPWFKSIKAKRDGVTLFTVDLSSPFEYTMYSSTYPWDRYVSNNSVIQITTNTGDIGLFGSNSTVRVNDYYYIDGSYYDGILTLSSSLSSGELREFFVGDEANPPCTGQMEGGFRYLVQPVNASNIYYFNRPAIFPRLQYVVENNKLKVKGIIAVKGSISDVTLTSVLRMI